MNLEKATQARELYFSRQMTQKQIAAKLGVKQNTVSRIVSGVVWNG